MTADLFNTADNCLAELPGRQVSYLHKDWQAALNTPAPRKALSELDAFLEARLTEGVSVFPSRIFRALEMLAPQDVRVVILGQDPYHGRGQAQGLAFSVPDSCPAPPSLRNIFQELALEFPGCPPRRRNDLSDWTRQGVLLLNTCLTVEEATAGSHARRGWETITDAIIGTVAGSAQPKVFMLWGAHAQARRETIERVGNHYTILSANHPSPLSARRPPTPFIGCGHFIRANTWLRTMGEPGIDWIGMPC